jgi:hypothetical protein
MKYYCFLLTLSFLTLTCRPYKNENDSAWQKLKFSLKDLDHAGLKGDKTGKVAMNYEFCIPNRAGLKAEVMRADPSIQFHTSKGRVGCGKMELLCIGSTNQAQYKKRLYKLCQLDYVQSIEQTFWE